jgi:hypothetical protein
MNIFHEWTLWCGSFIGGAGVVGVVIVKMETKRLNSAKNRMIPRYTGLAMVRYPRWLEVAGQLSVLGVVIGCVLLVIAVATR